ncbi:hypothetical protein KKB40_02930 [Patescibacteria group bacterium]|nr:hypothetical protein [Patescibacteria group bacterium]
MPAASKKKGSSPKKLLLVLVPLALVFVFVFFALRASKGNTIILNEFPIWILDNGTTIYREMEVSPTKIKKTILVDIPDDTEEKVQIYEAIPKDVAESASSLSFSVEPEIIEDDPLVLWNLDPEKKKKELSWWETATFLPKVGIFVAQTVGRAVVGEATGACDTQVAQEWMKKQSYSSEPNFIDCSKYIEHINKEVQERETKEWQNKLENGKITKSIDPEDEEYEETRARLKQKSKTKTDQSTSTSKISKEEAIVAVKEQYQKPLKGEGEWWPTATCEPENTEYIKSEKKWHVICIRPRHSFGDMAHAAICEGQWFFFTIDDNGKANQEGWYSKCTYDKDGSNASRGTPMWGVK